MTDQHPAAIAADGRLDRDQWRRAITENLAALRGLLEHAGSWALGFGWRGEPVPPGWVAPWAADPDRYRAAW